MFSIFRDSRSIKTKITMVAACRTCMFIFPLDVVTNLLCYRGGRVRFCGVLKFIIFGVPLSYLRKIILKSINKKLLGVFWGVRKDSSK